MEPPQVVVLILHLGRLLEILRRAALRVEPCGYRLDRALLAGAVYGLKDDEQRVRLLSHQLVLQPGHLGVIALEFLHSASKINAARPILSYVARLRGQGKCQNEFTRVLPEPCSFD
jgi:hypothetical protein